MISDGRKGWACNIGLNYLKCILSKAKNVLTIGKHSVQIKKLIILLHKMYYINIKRYNPMIKKTYSIEYNFHNNTDFILMNDNL